MSAPAKLVFLLVYALLIAGLLSDDAQALHRACGIAAVVVGFSVGWWVVGPLIKGAKQ